MLFKLGWCRQLRFDREFEMIRENKQSRNPALASKVVVIDPAAPPALAYTIIRSVILAGQKLPSSELFWNSLFVAVLRKAGEVVPSDQRPALVTCRHEFGKRRDAGFKYVPTLGISVQAQSAASAWKTTYQVLLVAKLSIELEFEWDNHPSAAFPGVRANMSVA